MIMIIILYVNDLVLAGSDNVAVVSLKCALVKRFEMKKDGRLKSF